MFMVFIESSIFTRLLPKYLTDSSYRKLQIFIQDQPNAGNIIQGTGGLRKLRWADRGHGKRGGIRIIYYWRTKDNQIFMMTLYAKNEVVDLTAKERLTLKKLVRRWSDDQT